MLKIITNNQPRHTLDWYDLSPKEQKEFDYLKDPEETTFFRYKGHIYDFGEMMRVSPDNEDMKDWDGYSSDSFFSGIVIKMRNRDEKIIVGRYYS